MMTKTLYIGLLVLLGVISPQRKALEKAVQKAPGDMGLRCELIGTMLAEGDTVAAEEQLTYAMRLRSAGCLHIHHGRIALGRGKRIDAAADCAQAVAAGLMPDDEPFVYQMDSTLPHLVTMRLRMAMQKEKANAFIPTGIGQLALQRGDTAAAITAYKEACQRGDTTLKAVVDSLEEVINRANGANWTNKTNESTDSLSEATARIAFTRNGGKIEVQCAINGLEIKAEVDTTATESTISTVEAHFMLKNSYVTQENVVNDNTLIIREIDFGEGLILRGVRLHHRRTQEETVIFCLSDLKQLGTVVINEEKKELQLYTKQ